MVKLISFVVEKISVKFDFHKLKKLNDLGFIIVEKIVVNLDGLLPVYLDFYKEMVENEIILANISKKDEILHIGCGSVPSTSILISKKTDSRVTAIDKKYKSVKQAKKLLSRLNLSDKIEIEHKDVSKFHLEKFDLIIVSQGIKPYNETLDHISKTMKNGARLILRTTSSSDGNLADKDSFLNEIFHIGKIVNQKKNGLLISVLLSKKQ